MKTPLKFLLVFCLTAALALGMALSSFAAQITVNSVVGYGPKYPLTIIYLETLKKIQERADREFPGVLHINHRGGPEVIAAGEQVEALRTGMVDIISTASAFYVSAMPEMDTLGLSELTPTEQRASGLFDYLNEIHRQKLGITYLGLASGSMFFLFTSKPFDSLDDLKGWRIRVSPTTIALMKMLDVEPVTTPLTDIYTAVERGVVDGFIVPPNNLPDLGLTAMAKFTLIPSFYSPSNPFLMNAAKWDSLPEGIQKIFSEEIANVEQRILEQNQAEELGVLDQVRAAGGKLVELPPAEAARFTEMANKALLETTTSKSPVEAQRIFELSRKAK